MKLFKIVLALASLLSTVTAQASNRYEVQFDNIWDTVKQDYSSFYTKNRLLRFGSVFSVGAVMAHTSIDTEFQSWYQDDIHSADTDDVAKVAKLFGEKTILMPVAALASALEFVEPDSNVAHWGQLSLRAYLLGGPIIGVTQPLTGGARPRDSVGDARWRSFEDDNGVSGHSFVAAVPFLALAKMSNLQPWQKNLAYGASMLGAWSRVNDDAHYLSQAILGWYVAWESLNAIGQNDVADWYQVTPYVFGDGAGVSLQFKW
ncbi:MAG: phosphatase PAP2 family protein [Gammaproteobacteria bacterium]|nr:phosphatase PAP2 family protein [Gammaproteobacteria bacterium]